MTTESRDDSSRADPGPEKPHRGPRSDRQRRRSGRGERKERVLHTRVSEELSEDIRRLAEDLRVPTSNLVRNVLEEVFSVVERVSDNVGDLFGDLLEEAEGARERVQRQMDRHDERRERRDGFRESRGRHSSRHRRGLSEDDVEQELRRDEQAESGPAPERKEFPDVLGWQPLVLNRAQACADCGVHLQKGERAFLGVRAGGLSELALCSECVRA